MLNVPAKKRAAAMRRATWTPAQLPNLALWLDAADSATITANASNQVTQWRDKSGENRHVAPYSEATSALTGQGTQNGKNYLLFGSTGMTGLHAGSNYLFATSANGGLTIIIAKEAGATGSSIPFMLDFGNWAADGYGMAASRCYAATGFGGKDFYGYKVASTRCTMVAPFGVAKTQTLWHDGEVVGSASISLSKLTATEIREGPAAGNPNAWSGPLTIGRSSKPSSDRYYIGGIYEILVCRAALADADRQTAEQYLKTKWGL